jgi:hypothetical protein
MPKFYPASARNAARGRCGQAERKKGPTSLSAPRSPFANPARRHHKGAPATLTSAAAGQNREGA